MTLIHRTLPATAGAGGLNKYWNSNSNDKKKKEKKTIKIREIQVKYIMKQVLLLEA